MFWKCIRWGGTLMVMLLLFAALYLADHPEENAVSAQPAESPSQPNKNFNL